MNIQILDIHIYYSLVDIYIYISYMHWQKRIRRKRKLKWHIRKMERERRKIKIDIRWKAHRIGWKSQRQKNRDTLWETSWRVDDSRRCCVLFLRYGDTYHCDLECGLRKSCRDVFMSYQVGTSLLSKQQW